MEWRIKLEARSGWGWVETIELASFKRRVVGLTAEEIGLSLEEAKQILAELQRRVLQTQMEEYTYCAHVCPACLKMRRQRASRTRTIQTLFGTVTVEAPRISICPCSNTRGFVDLSFSSLADLLPDRCTPELRRLQADLGARHSFREAGRILSQLLPCAPANHATIRNRTHRVAADMEAPSNAGGAVPSVSSKETVVMIDGAHIRAVPAHQSRHLDVTVGKVEVAGRKPRRFAFAPKGADRPLDVLRAALGEQGWRPGQKLTVISDGEAVLANLVRAATREPVRHILDWFHLSMHMRPIEPMLLGLSSRELCDIHPLQQAQASIGHVRHLLWHGRPAQAHQELIRFASHAGNIAGTGANPEQVVTRDLLRHSSELRSYGQNNRRAIASYHRRYQNDRPISTSRAEGCVDEIVNARMGRRQRMRWSPRGAHRVAIVRAAVLDGWLEASFLQSDGSLIDQEFSTPGGDTQPVAAGADPIASR